MASQAIVVGVTDMRFVRELRVVSFACSGKHRRIVGGLLSVANDAAGFLRGFLVAAGRRMANVTFVVSGDADQSRFLGLLVAKIAVGFLPIRQIVRRVSFVLLGVKKRIEIIARLKITLRRTSRQSIFGVVANRAGLLRLGDELLDVAFDAGFVTGKFQPRLFVAVGGRNQVFHKIALVVAGIAFQFVRLKRARHFDYAEVRFVRELLVIGRRSLNRSRRRRRRRFGLLPQSSKRIEQRQTRGQAAERQREFYFFHPHLFIRFQPSKLAGTFQGLFGA